MNSPPPPQKKNNNNNLIFGMNSENIVKNSSDLAYNKNYELKKKERYNRYYKKREEGKLKGLTNEYINLKVQINLYANIFKQEDKGSNENYIEQVLSSSILDKCREYYKKIFPGIIESEIKELIEMHRNRRSEMIKLYKEGMQEEKIEIRLHEVYTPIRELILSRYIDRIEKNKK